MHYDFETLVNRTGTGSSKWEGMKKHNPNIERDIVPLSVADMELKNAPEIIEGLQDYLAMPSWAIPPRPKDIWLR